jgi:hypothetical protein
MATRQDRAAVVARNIRRILDDIADVGEQDSQIEALLRDEFAEIKFEAASERTLAD